MPFVIQIQVCWTWRHLAEEINWILLKEIWETNRIQSNCNSVEKTFHDTRSAAAKRNSTLTHYINFIQSMPGQQRAEDRQRNEKHFNNKREGVNYCTAQWLQLTGEGTERDVGLRCVTCWRPQTPLNWNGLALKSGVLATGGGTGTVGDKCSQYRYDRRSPVASSSSWSLLDLQYLI